MRRNDISKIGKNVEKMLGKADINDTVDVPISSKTAANRVLEYLSNTGRKDYGILASGYDSSVYVLQLQKVGEPQNA